MSSLKTISKELQQRTIYRWSKSSEASLYTLYGVIQRRDQSETKGYQYHDPLPRWKFQHVHVPHTPTGVACGKRPPHSSRPQASQPLFASRPCTKHWKRCNFFRTENQTCSDSISQQLPSQQVDEGIWHVHFWIVGQGPWANFSGSLTAKDTKKAGLHVQLIFAPLKSSLHKKQGAVGNKKQSTFMNGHLPC